jgi:hypothetical protein
MARANKTRDNGVEQKKGVCVAVIEIAEADILVDGSVYVNMPPRSLITRVVSRQIVTSTTATSTLDVLANGVVLVNEADCSSADGTVVDHTLVAAAQYLATGGELVIKAGAVTPAAGDLTAEFVVEYIELDKNTGELTRHLAS